MCVLEEWDGFSENKWNDSLFPFSCFGSWKWDNYCMALTAFGRAPSGLRYSAWKSLHHKREKFFLVSKSSCFADSQSLLCEVDSWVLKPFIFPSSLYGTNLIFVLREFVCSSLACHCFLSLSSTAAVFGVQECEECCIWAESGWNCYGNWWFFFFSLLSLEIATCFGVNQFITR